MATGLVAAAVVCAGLLSALTPPEASAQSPTPTPEPHVDAFALPSLPEEPSQAEMGEYLYYFHCMPCHGDQGQGLTDDFRQLWVDDHQNCWGRGCHAGRPGDEGFPIPRQIPAVIRPDGLAGFAEFDDLESYLRLTHPPQEPGRLTEVEYRGLTAYLWGANGRSQPQTQAATAGGVTAVSLGLLAAVFLAAWAALRSRPAV